MEEHNAGVAAETLVASGEAPHDQTGYLRRAGEPEVALKTSPTVAISLEAFNRVVSTRKSEVVLMWPRGIYGPAFLHGLAALERLRECDEKKLTTLFFPWNRNSASPQRQILVDRDYIYQSTLPPLNRVSERSAHPAYAYVLALHSLNSLTTLRNARLAELLRKDPGLGHPTLFEIMPQQGLQESGLQTYETHFLYRLQRFTWMRRRPTQMEAATDPKSTPFFLFGADCDAVSLSALRTLGVDAQHDGRMPDVVLIDLTARARNRLGRDWQCSIKRFLDVTLELYLDDCPPVLAVTDDALVCQILRHEILREHDKWRSSNVSGPVRPAKAEMIITRDPDPLSQETLASGPVPSFKAEVYGTDILQMVERGLRLRRSFIAVGEDAIGEAVGRAIICLQNILSIPGDPREFHEFLTARYEGYQRQSWGARFDYQTPVSNLVSVSRSGFAGSFHTELLAFLRAIDELSRAAERDNPGRRRFDGYIRNLSHGVSKTMMVFPTEVQRAFAEWRFENEGAFEEARARLGESLTLVERRDINDELDRSEQLYDFVERLVFFEPRAEDVLSILARPTLPRSLVFLGNLAQVEQMLRRIRILLSLEGVAPVRDRLVAAEAELERALQGHTCDIGDLDSEEFRFHLGTLDFTDAAVGGSGPIRVIRVSDNLRVRAFDGTEFALYDPDALQHFSRRLARDLMPGDEICVFTPDLIGLARERFKFSANAPDVLKLYHKAIMEASEHLPGRDFTSKAVALRARMLEMDPAPDLPGVEAMRRWIDVANLLDAPRDSVRPQAPGSRRHFLTFMKALNISEDVAHLYWNLGIFMTKSKRIQRGAFFHQTFMAVLLDPDGTASRLDDASGSAMWQIYDAATDHVATVISNELEGER
jgi:hypothetical protein